MGARLDFPGSTEMHGLVNAYDWSASALGDVSGWPVSLKVLTRAILASRYPMIVMWGPKFVSIYNDGYHDVVGALHPRLLGQSASEVFGESWSAIVPPIQDAIDNGTTSWFPALQLPMNRNGYREEAYFTASHAPATDDDGVRVGMHGVCNDVTDQVIGSRRLALLTELSAVTAVVQTVEEMTNDLCDVLSRNTLDVPLFSLLLEYPDGVLRAAGNNDQLLGGAVRETCMGAMESKAPVMVALDDPKVVGGAWGDRVTEVLVAPLGALSAEPAIGALVAGVSPNRVLDVEYQLFFDTLVRQISVGLSNSRAFQEERRRAESLQELDRVKTALFSNMSHEIRTPINAVAGGSCLLLETSLDSEQEQLVQMIEQSAQDLIRIVNDILDYAKLDAGKFEFAYDPFDVTECIALALNTVRLRAIEKGLEIRSAVADDVPRVILGDGPRLRQVLLNLLSNAIKFTEFGSVTVEATCEKERLRISVIDTGTGIPPDRLESVFDAFSQVESRVSTGTGLGLSISSSLAEGMGGAVSVTSVVGDGSAFCIEIPAQETTSQPRVVERQTIDAGLGDRVPLRILIAEDQVTNQQVLTALLKRLGYSADVVETGAAAVDAAANGSYDLVLMDVQMPEMDGFEASAEIVRLLPQGRRPRIVALTANARHESRQRALSVGMSGYLTKPFSLQELVDVLCENGEKTVVPAETVDMSEASESPCVDRRQLEPIAECGQSVLAEVIDSYLLTAENLVSKVETVRETDGTSADLRAMLHQLKGASATIGAAQLANLCSVDPHTEALPAKLRSEFGRVQAALQELRDAQLLSGDRCP